MNFSNDAYLTLYSTIIVLAILINWINGMVWDGWALLRWMYWRLTNDRTLDHWFLDEAAKHNAQKRWEKWLFRKAG